MARCIGRSRLLLQVGQGCGLMAASGEENSMIAVVGL